ncbi:hypothetical protein FC093_09550 [Ilyomonas limi]|uniref:Uncharacterized protein n=1 Tax=Ilyomonas limi TaxID=2575867 RepID=A0A4U3L3Q2_9BACT|nr:hypothetical protein [Ilyomonas limi]TKK68929.1 hypothetical protein FC093_09550 [Ilyomonas limi]
MRNQLNVGDGLRERTNAISVAFTTKFTGKAKTQPSTIIMALKNSILIKSSVNKIITQSRNNTLHIKATLARNNSQRIFFGEKYH